MRHEMMQQPMREIRTSLAETELLRGWPVTALILVFTSILAVQLQPMLQGEVSSGLIFVLGITLVGATSGLVPSLICAVAASVVFNFFLADPVLTFRISKGDDLAPPVIFTLCALVSGILSGRLRDRTFQLGKTNLQLESLLDTSSKLQSASDVRAIQYVLKETVLGRLDFKVYLFENVDGRGKAVDGDACEPHLLHLADQLISGLRTIRKNDIVAFRLEGSRSCVGALVMEQSGNAKVDPAFMLAIASLVGLAVERAQMASVLAEAEANLRAEGLKTALLSSVSHDLRTPLTTINASASSLIDYGSQLDDETSNNLLQTIVDECERLNRFTANLLEMSRLQSGGSEISNQVQSAQDVVRSVVQRARLRNEGHDIRLTAGGEEILVRSDNALFELALTNVVQNAIQYSPGGTSIQIDLWRRGKECVIDVTDEGCGIPEGEHERVFERFYRVKRDDSAPKGSGLGLAIAKGFVEAFNGTISLYSPVKDGKGTAVRIALPAIGKAGS